jgi:hypothetical protein
MFKYIITKVGLLSFGGVAFLSLAVIVAHADQKEKRIRFEKGRTSAVVKDVVTDSVQENVHTYRLKVGKGQTMILHLASPVKAANFIPSLPDDSTPTDASGSVELKDWDGTIPASGDVIINIYHKGTRRGMPYTLEVTVR